MKQKKFLQKNRTASEKFLLLFFISILSLSVLVLVFNKLIINKQNELKRESYTEIYDHLDSITLESFKEKNINNENFIVYVGRDTCVDCNEFEPLLIDYLDRKKNRFNLYYLNTRKIHENKGKWDEFKREYSIEYTPTFAEFNKGKLVSKIEWTPDDGISIESINNWFLTKSDSLKNK